MAHHITSSRATDFPSIAPISDQPTEQRSVVAQGQTLFRRMQCWWLRLVGVLFRPTLPPMSALAGRPALRQALYRLPKEQRLALWSIDVEGLSHAEAAVRYDCDLDVVRERLRLARTQMAALLTEAPGTGHPAAPVLDDGLSEPQSYGPSSAVVTSRASTAVHPRETSPEA